MSQITSMTALVQTPLATAPRMSNRPAKRVMIVRASAEETSRRAAMGLMASTVLSVLTAGAAFAKVKNPAQDSIRKAGSSSDASQSAFNMTGIKKRGLTPSARKDFLSEAKAKASALASKAVQAVK